MAGSRATTHFVIADTHVDDDTLQPPSDNCHCVTADVSDIPITFIRSALQWFWASIALDLCANEQLYAAGVVAQAQQRKCNAEARQQHNKVWTNETLSTIVSFRRNRLQ